MSATVTIWTYDWVPEMPRGFVRDIRLRWACEEAGLAYSVGTVPFDARGPAHLARQPYGQVPFLTAAPSRCSKAAPGFSIWPRRAKR